MPSQEGTERDAWRLGGLFAAYFGFVGILAPYFPLYLESRGLTAFQVGVLIALGQAMRVIGEPLGYLADHASRRTPILRATSIALLLSLRCCWFLARSSGSLP